MVQISPLRGSESYVVNTILQRFSREAAVMSMTGIILTLKYNEKINSISFLVKLQQTINV